jgi:hypothetical protein
MRHCAAVLIAASALVAGCTHVESGQPQRVQPIPSLTPTTAQSAPPSTTSTSSSTAAPSPQTPLADVINWIEAGQAVDPAAYHAATRDGEVTPLGSDVAFLTGDKSMCATDGAHGHGLACLVKLTAAPPRPANAYGVWKGGWVDYDGTSVEVGSLHGDPGRFALGAGRELPDGSALAFGDYRCRTDAAGLFCANYAHQSAVGFAPSGITTYGCLQSVTPPPEIGLKFSC